MLPIHEYSILFAFPISAVTHIAPATSVMSYTTTSGAIHIATPSNDNELPEYLPTNDDIGPPPTGPTPRSGPRHPPGGIRAWELPPGGILPEGGMPTIEIPSYMQLVPPPYEPGKINA